MIRKQNGLQNYKVPEKELRWAYLFFGLLLAWAFGNLCYKAYIGYTSEIRYTVINFYEKYYDSKGTGMKVFYLVDGETIKEVCFSFDCKQVQKGERRLGYYFVDDPSFFGILYDIKVPSSVMPPQNGWETIPDYLKPKKKRS
ncbi:hypothetical protein [Algoriphagus zhangzhouensis]|uniref:Uncharacterized protein n=1 Tax=Algoriphagus zhangzhouensis TaxID=1073327 RepID=A0A1M7Z4M7_9BACT|nr:hypothetical protein [Algoriphagus zhangzhouensis]TDY48703.1 hypothetical protein A8938_0389 [Algoriphagus zhangzhouensis]SHO59825.1 hypothetical protein SAMN04488108_0389 [Algoriphagus zhangzhouensis]